MKMTWRRSKGQTLVETAIILPILLLIVFGLIDFGRAMYTKNTLNNAARSAARVAAVTVSLSPQSGVLGPGNPLGPRESEPVAAIRNNLFNGIDPALISYAVRVLDRTGTTPVAGTATKGDLVEVTVTWNNFPMWTPLYKIASLISSSSPQESGSLTLTGKAAMRYE